MSKLERTKLAYDNLESPEVCSTGVAQRSSAIAVEMRIFIGSKSMPLNDISLDKNL